jgi:hypothetical protein
MIPWVEDSSKYYLLIMCISDIVIPMIVVLMGNLRVPHQEDF